MPEKKEESVFCTNKKGSFFGLKKNVESQYEGLFFFLEDDWEPYKTISDFKPEGKARCFFRGDVFVIETKKPFFLEVDFRRVHDFDDAGRIYDVSHEGTDLVVNYKKYSGHDLKELKEERKLVLKGVKRYEQLHEWSARHYPYDSKRNTKSDFYVYEIGRIVPLKGIVEAVFEERNGEESERLVSQDTDFERALVALDNLHMDIAGMKGIFAGLPWFYQYWSRDELISVIGLIEAGKYFEAKEILLRYHDMIMEDGILPNRYPSSGLGSADATGWLYKRSQDLIERIEKEGETGLITMQELLLMHKKASITIMRAKERMNNGLIPNSALETWMDTHEGNHEDVREGYRVEIQALYLATYKFLNFINKLVDRERPELKREEEEFRENVKKKLFRKHLVDGLDKDMKPDLTVRPNVFLAYYAYPELLSEGEWKTTFDKTLRACWLQWGGLSSISKKHALFRARHTGMTNESYHRGDSWYFINNIAAISMHRLDRIKYSSKIKKIVKASTKEMNKMGLIGQCAEISSAEEQTSEGCLAQAWSAATLAELLSETEQKMF